MEGGRGRRDSSDTSTTEPTFTQCEIPQTGPTLTVNHGESLISTCELRSCFLLGTFWRERFKMSAWWWGHEFFCMVTPGIGGRITRKHAAVLLVTAPCCGLAGGYRRFVGTCFLHLVILLKIWSCGMVCRNVAAFYVVLCSPVQGLLYLEDWSKFTLYVCLFVVYWTILRLGDSEWWIVKDMEGCRYTRTDLCYPHFW